METLRYYFEDGTFVIFDKYTIDTTGVIRNQATGKVLRYFKDGDYNTCGVYDIEVKKRRVKIGRAIASTFIGPSPSLHHTADHIDRNPNNDTLENIRWLCKKEQNTNQTRPDNLKCAFVIVKGGIEKTAKEWTEHLKAQKTSYGNDYTPDVVKNYARNKRHGFEFKKYPNLPGEVWKKVKDSENRIGYWEISDMNRVKYVTNFAENVLCGDQLCRKTGYPVIGINGKVWKCHILSFLTFFSDKYDTRKPNEVIMHEDDDRSDFRPHKLRLGTKSDNTIDAHDNGKYDGTKSARMKCASYIDGVFEKEHNSQHDAVRYLKMNDHDKAQCSKIGQALSSFREGKVVTRYGRTWQII